MSKKDEALKLAREALEEIGDEWGFTSKRTIPNRKAAITAIREALAEQPEQKREWVGLTEQEIGKAYDDYQSGRVSAGFNGAARAIEAKLKEKNS